MPQHEQNDTCDKCGKPLVRSWVCNECVMWSCEDDACDCPAEMEPFSDLDDAGWAWLREHYKHV